MQTQFIGSSDFSLSAQTVRTECPSNIALIKYWGKYPDQIPANPSISYTLNHAKTITEIHFIPHENFSVSVFLSENEQIDFGKKIEKYFHSISIYLPWILKGKYIIHTQNTFPHSSGIASSASGYGAIADCLMQLDSIFSSTKSQNPFYLQKISFLARLGSGSACRSIYPGLVVWGETPTLPGSSDLFAVPYPNESIHPKFRNFHDWVLLVHEGKKSVSSTVGHGLMKTNPYAKQRFIEARNNFHTLKKILQEGDMNAFISLVEHEALTLHAMMMMSTPAFILMQKNTLEIINKIWTYRKETQNPIFFTLDAGANVHILFPENDKTLEIQSFINEKLLSYTQNNGIVKDRIIF